MPILRFSGVVRSGCGKFSVELGLPGRAVVSRTIRDWPDNLHPGTLNVHVIGGFPAEYIEVFGMPDLRLLDSRRFAPEAELDWTEIAGNTLLPMFGRPDRGNAQVWRATLRKSGTNMECQCWMLRRIGSAISMDIELVAREKLRDQLQLLDGTAVEIELEGEWVDI